MTRFIRLSAAVLLSLAVAGPALAAEPGNPWAWGWNKFGELGTGDTVERDSPVPVAGVTEVIAVAGGGAHSLALKADGSVWGWGSNARGALGDGSAVAERHIPVRAQIDNVTAIVAGSSLSLAIKKDGTLWAWGQNSFGLLGMGTQDQNSHPTPAAVPGLASVQAVAAGEYHNLVLLKDGTVRTWGSNAVGALGTGPHADDAVSYQPVEVPNLTEVQAIGAGWHFSLALKRNGTVWMWGQQLGTHMPSPTQVANLNDVVAIAAGSSTAYAIKRDGTVWGWGSNHPGALGDSSASAIQVTPIEIPALAGVRTIVINRSPRASGFAIKPDGTVLAWGANDNGMLGLGTADYDRHSTPQVIPGLNRVTTVSGGGFQTLAVVAPATQLPIDASSVDLSLVSLDACRLYDWACRAEPKLSPGTIGLQCNVRNCINVEAVPKLCQVALKCPGCSAAGMCPPQYSLTLEGLGDAWSVGLFDTKGRPVPHNRTGIKDGVAITFQPSKENYIDGQIGDYLLGFQMGPKGKTGVQYNVRAQLQTGGTTAGAPSKDELSGKLKR
jgi:alpha-tubulin suppressor-like RCC1 family protein